LDTEPSRSADTEGTEDRSVLGFLFYDETIFDSVLSVSELCVLCDKISSAQTRLLRNFSGYDILDSAVDSHKEAQKAQRNTDAKILELTRQVNGFLIRFLMHLSVFVPFCGNSNWVF
jgi:hypothetical protein